MLFKNKLLVSLASVAVIGGTGIGIYHGSGKDKKALEIEKQETEEEKKSKIIAQNKKILDDLLAECKKGIMENLYWKSLYNPSLISETEINFESGSKKVKMKISKNKDNDYRKIIDTTDKWWPGQEKRFIVFEISEKF